MRIFALSDIHLDYPPNLTWLKGLSAFDYQEDVLILAGDISDQTDLVSLSFKLLTSRFRQVLFVPGNHELWIVRSHHRCSLEKYHEICNLADEFSISMKPMTVSDFVIVPMLSWYDFSFGEPGTELLKVWMDFKACQWPQDMNVAEFFLNQNPNTLPEASDKTVITFSHFLPRIDVMPPYIPEKHRKIYPVLGTSQLDEQIRLLGSSLHIYGHSHVNRNTVIDGIRYINNAYGYPAETRITLKRLHCIYES